MVANNMNKNASAKILQPERKTAFRPPKKSTGFPRSGPPNLQKGHTELEEKHTELAKEPPLNAETATVAVQLWPFRNLIWAFSGLFSGPSSCQ